jgi:thiol-disulfide isomerase/thioredoxin
MLAAVLFSLLLAPGDRVTVYVFTTTDCPISNRYAPEIQRLAAKFGSSATFVLVYPVPADTPQVIADHKKKFAYTIGHVRDLDQKLVKLTGVTVTPEVAVVDGAQVLYRGRIDDRYVDFGTARTKPTKRDLEDALTTVLAGKPIAVRETRAVGCILADLVK